MSTLLHVLVMTLDATGTVLFWELNQQSLSISDAKFLIEHAEGWKDSPPQVRVLGVVVTAFPPRKSPPSALRPRLIPCVGCSESASRAWEFGKYSLGYPGPALLLPEGPAGATML